MNKAPVFRNGVAMSTGVREKMDGRNGRNHGPVGRSYPRGNSETAHRAVATLFRVARLLRAAPNFLCEGRLRARHVAYRAGRGVAASRGDSRCGEGPRAGRRA